MQAQTTVTTGKNPPSSSKISTLAPQWTVVGRDSSTSPRLHVDMVERVSNKQNIGGSPPNFARRSGFRCLAAAPAREQMKRVFLQGHTLALQRQDRHSASP